MIASAIIFACGVAFGAVVMRYVFARWIIPSMADAFDRSLSETHIGRMQRLYGQHQVLEGLREATSEGPEAVARFLAAWDEAVDREAHSMGADMAMERN